MTERPKAPCLRHNYPDCGLCGEETSHDGDSLTCESCAIYWPDASGPGVFRNVDKTHCGATHQPFTWSRHENIRSDTYECLLDEGHEGEHQGLRRGSTGITWSWEAESTTTGETRDVPTPGMAT